jgi:glycerol-3-phosphate cytidylyltransferase
MKKYKVIYTTGAFDPFHYGHLIILKKAKKLAETLIVGVSTDALIRKDKKRQVFMPLEHRIKIIEELNCVDKVVPQIDKNKQGAVDELKVDAIVVGSDWKGKYPSVTCDIIYFDYTDNISSTMIRQKI